jgi:protein-disulfide isomerase
MSSRKLIYGGLALLLLVLVGAAALYLGNADAASTAADAAPVAAEKAAQAVAGGSTGTCGYDPEKAPVQDVEALIQETDPVLGDPDAAVTVMEFFDPNCPHCKALHPVMKAVQEDFGDRIRVVYKPVALWDFSKQQVAALLDAARAGAFSEMLDQQFERQQRGGLSMDQLKQIAQDAGMDLDTMERRVASGVYTSLMEQNMQQARAVGLTGVPAVLINGRVVAGSSRTYECLGALINEQLGTSAQ